MFQKAAPIVSAGPIAKVWRISMPAANKLVLIAVADNDQDDGTLHEPDIPTVAAFAGIPAWQVGPILGKLAAEGHIQMRDGAVRISR